MGRYWKYLVFVLLVGCGGVGFGGKVEEDRYLSGYADGISEIERNIRLRGQENLATESLALICKVTCGERGVSSVVAGRCSCLRDATGCELP